MGRSVSRVVTFGADPDKEDKPWEDSRSTTPQAYRGRVGSLVNAFAYHKNLKMSQRMEAEDKAILAGFFSRKIKAGVSVSTLRLLIDRFYSSSFSSTSFPAKVFVSSDAQTSLSSDIDVEHNDPYLDWLLAGMPTSETIDDSDYLRKLMLIESDQGLLRYPDVVATCIRVGKGSSAIASMIIALEDLIRWNLGEEEVRPDVSLLSKVGLPPELATNRRSPMLLRPPAPNVKQAIMRLKKR